MMSSKQRRSVRATRARVKYDQDASSSDEEESDKVKEAKLKLKQMMQEDSSGESDFEKEMVKETKKEQSSEDEGSEEERDDIKMEQEVLLNKYSNGRRGGGLQLSDSESSSDEETRQNRKRKNLVQGGRTDFRTSSVEENTQTQEENEQSSQTLMALAQNLAKIQGSWNEKEGVKKEVLDFTMDVPESVKGKGKGKRSRQQVKASASNGAMANLDSITKLLVKGENVDADELAEDAEADVQEKEHNKEPVVPSEGIQINIDLPEKARRKKKKGFDIAGFLKRELARARRETQVLLHQAHFLSLVAHLRYVNLVLTDEILYGSALSIIPPAHAAAPGLYTLNKLTGLVRWLRDFIPLYKKDNGQKSTSDSKKVIPMRDRVQRVLETYLAMDNLDLVNIFVLVCRALGLQTRIVMNFAVVSLKPPAESKSGSDLQDLLNEVKKEEGKKENEVKKEDVSPKKKAKKSASDSEGDEDDFNQSQNSLSSKLAAKSKTHSKPQASTITSSSKDRISSKASSRDKSSSKSSSSKSSSKASSKSARTEKSPQEKKTSRSSGRTSARAESKSLAAKLKEKSAKTSKSAKSKPDTKSSVDREEEMIRKLDEKYPTQEEELKTEPKGKSRKRKSDQQGECSNSTRGSSSSKGSKSTKKTAVNVYWAEVYLEKERRWIPVDLETGRMNSPKEIEGRLVKPVYYVVAIDNMGNMKDVTKRYVSDFMTSTRKLRFDEKWISRVVDAFNDKPDSQDSKEDLELMKKSEEAPMPTTVSAFKSHPLYVLKRHLLKFEAIYPPEAPPIGWMKSEPVYARECVFTLQGRTSWLKEGRCVKVGEDPYNVVKARPKWDRMKGEMRKDEPLEVFGKWQTVLYVPPPAVNGKVPRNEYGNVELFKPWMLPKGCAHIPINGMTRLLRKLDIDAAPAMMGWDFSGGCHPIYDGVVVCEEFVDTIMDAWNQEQAVKAERDAEKREKRVLDNWRRLIKGLFIRERIQAKYMKKE